MGQYIIKLKDEKTEQDYYFEWSEVVDAPISKGMTREDFTKYYSDKYGTSRISELEDRLKRVDEKGISAFLFDSVDELISTNRAGENETHLTKEQIISKYT